jgi:hypothetical protein
MLSRHEEKIMTKLSDSQLNVLSAAAAREGGEAVVPANMNKSAAAKVGSSLVARKLARELKTKPGMPVWREDANGRLISLIITKAGRKAIGVSDVAPDKNRNTNHKASTSGKTRPEGRENVKSGVTTAARAGSKQALVIEMLNAGSGVTLDALVGATGWLPHTTRAALTGLRKKGFSTERFSKGDASFYRIARTTPSAAA